MDSLQSQKEWRAKKLFHIEKFEDFCEINFHKFLKQAEGIVILQKWKLNKEPKKL